MKPTRYVAQALCLALLMMVVTACENKPGKDIPRVNTQDPGKDTTSPPPPPKPAVDPVKAVTPPTAPQAAEVFKFSGDDSAIGFVGYNMIGGREGGFSDFSGTVSVAGGKLETTTVDLTIKMASVFSDSAILTPKLKGDKGFFEVDKFPTATFKTTKAVKDEKDPTMYTLTGSLNLHGIDKTVGVPVKIDLKGKELTAKSEFAVNRHDWQIEYAGEGDFAVKDEVLIKLDIKATLDPNAKPGAPAAAAPAAAPAAPAAPAPAPAAAPAAAPAPAPAATPAPAPAPAPAAK